MSLVITGNMLGAGILAVPIKTGLSGFLPSLVGILVTWGIMLATALIFASQKSLTESETADLPTFFQKELGNTGKWVTIIANLIILYGVLVAYISGAGTILHNLFRQVVPIQLLMLLFFSMATGLAFFGMAFIRKGSTVIMCLMWLTFLVLIIMTGKGMNTERLTYMDWQFLPATLPIMVTAFHFHNIIPSFCRHMGFDYRAIKTSIILGALIGLCMHIIWAIVVIGRLPVIGDGVDTIDYAFNNNLPATVPLSHIVRNPIFTLSSIVFPLLSITVAYMANGTALTGFLRDLTTTYFHKSGKFLVSALVFMPPLAVSLIYPNLFLEALDIVGGFGIDIIFGILPGVVVVKYLRGPKRLMGWVLIAVFSIILLYEFMQEFGILYIRPEIEYWFTDLKH